MAVPMLVLMASALRFVGKAPDYDDAIWTDVGRALATTGVPLRTWNMPGPAMFYDHTPLYTYLVGVLSLVPLDTVSLARFVSLLFGLGTVAVVYAIGARASVAWGFAAALIVAVNPLFGWLSWLMRMETAWAFCSMVALWALLERRWAVAGIAVATSVMFKELGIVLWVVATVYAVGQPSLAVPVKVREQVRPELLPGEVARKLHIAHLTPALLVAVPTVVAFSAWLAYAAWLDWDQLAYTLWRWVDAAGAGTMDDPRMHVTTAAWTATVVWSLSASLVALFGAAVLRRWWVPLTYCGLAIVGSYAVTLKEPRYLTVVIPMAAVAWTLRRDVLVREVVRDDEVAGGARLRPRHLIEQRPRHLHGVDGG